MEPISVISPCSTANLGSGFDVFGLAIEAFHDVLTVELTDRGITIEVAGFDADKVSTDTDKNTAGLVARELLRDRELGLKIRIEKGIPVNMGLGSSGASAAACAVACNHILKLCLSQSELVRIAAIGEVASTGVSHADNVSASILGGFTIVQPYDKPVSAIRLDPPLSMEVAIAMPFIATPPNKTARARAILPTSVPPENALFNARNAAWIVAGFHLGDVGLIGNGMEDMLAEPVRSKLIPNYYSVKKNALNAGASGVAISGAGPAVIAVTDKDKASTRDVACAMSEAFLNAGVTCRTCCSRPSVKGTRILAR